MTTRKYAPSPFAVRPLVFALLTVVLPFVLAVQPAAPARGQARVTLAPVPLSQVIEFGATAPVELRLGDVADLSSFEIDLAYDPAVVSLERVERLVGTPSYPTARSWVSLPTTNDPNVTFVPIEPGLVSFGGYSFAPDNPAGPEGDVPLVRLHLRGMAVGDSPLRIERALLADTAAQVIAATMQAGRVSVVAAVERPHRLFIPLIAARHLPDN